MNFTIEPLAVPDSLDGPGAEQFVALAAVRNAVEAAALGSHLLTPSVEELLAEYRSNPTRTRTHFTASVGRDIVGCAMVTTRPHLVGAGAHLGVEVLPEHRGHGIGAALLRQAEDVASAGVERVLKVAVSHAASEFDERIVAPTGFGELPANDPGARFLLRHGYGLEQVVRISLLDTEGLADRLPALLAEAEQVAGADHRRHGWIGPTPSEWVEDMATLRTRMSTDAPMAGLQGPPDPWDAARVEDHDRRIESGGSIVITTAVEHLPSGQLVGFSEIVVPEDRPIATQEDTLVLREHRGHRLGLLLKAATASELLRVFPEIESVVTWNAEENRPMLDVNDALGFRAIGYEGGWRKDL
ncbi:GNAT family N-acetyltransferase [Aeromicrobium sp. CF3.5]|uniref:GNAT family N-acetyltransferase n=1 Tax=Aeromicrobium sp. CF3.5 TaxID=3373078 RepID=UPI003EE704BA